MKRALRRACDPLPATPIYALAVGVTVVTGFWAVVCYVVLGLLV